MADIHLPQHIAIIMDGNGRWAKQRFMPRIAGHRAGVEAARQVVKNCARRNIKVLSLFAFSSENWRRPAQEVSFLMELFLTGLEREVGMLHENNIQLRFIGDRSRFSEKLCEKIKEVEQLTQKNTGMTLIIAVDYGGQWDICQAARQLALEVEAGTLRSQEITPEKFASRLSFSDLPNPDLFIRTSGELRISNFMLWQLAYSELYFTDILWPDFDENELEKALKHYSSRERRYGYSSEQLKEAARHA
ncbi:isoprenyl transferase [Aquicella lusitana]|uniref:Ditrans,polycis-undecaprenyl-diphosphate synthase ((2E,6E)-farnesyl-diphosphate specific) n=1 Tax=Aquicella lusitana TaxID=254246 RepID=A0A370GIP3_9COXI|nr:isoprenyl transferase [Aquicella lusitana]RDI41803.1 undecaprenyl pyrophosphate synthetase [Aquicella lusitana]VVC73711.1 Ditrans,polycis-undecaprenyl-diphosphate synthase ((2E,6E)-farnesyl-diphosphate specific) [Aquicella lusitana]